MSQRIMMSGARITLQERREVTLATEMGHPCRTAAQPAGKGLGFGGRPVLGANSDCSRVTWGKTSHSPELPQTPDRGNNFIPLWIKWDSPRKPPGLCKHLPNGCPQGTQEASAPESGLGHGQARQRRQRNAARRPRCQVLRPLATHHRLAVGTRLAAFFVSTSGCHKEVGGSSPRPRGLSAPTEPTAAHTHRLFACCFSHWP